MREMHYYIYLTYDKTIKLYTLSFEYLIKHSNDILSDFDLKIIFNDILYEYLIKYLKLDILFAV